MAIDEAEVGGRFEGSLVVRNRLVIKATGRVSGTIRYGPVDPSPFTALLTLRLPH
jgi:cytoskeletal protein CcmA (bactofilin family)